jgi:predicted transcriptional regulator
MSKKLVEMASEIVQTQVSLRPMSAAEITSSLRQVFGTLNELQKAEAGGIELALTAEGTGEATIEGKPVLSPADSIQDGKIIGQSPKQSGEKESIARESEEGD